MNETAKQGITALKSGHKSRARELLRRAVEENPDDVQAWLWLSGAVETDRERVVCLQRVLELDPDNTAAIRGLAKLLSEGSVSLHPEVRQAPQTEGMAEAAGPPSAASGASSETASQPRPSSRQSVREKQFTVRPSVVPVLMASFLGASLFAVLFAFLNIGISDEAFIASLTNFVLVVMAAGLGIRVFLIFLRRLFTRYTLTSDHLVVKRGILSRSEKTIPIGRIQDVATKQSILERPFGIGDVVVETAGERGAAVLDDLPRCRAYSNAILRAAEEQETKARSAT